MDPALESSAVKYIDFGLLASWFQDIRQLPDRLLYRVPGRAWTSPNFPSHKAARLFGAAQF
jgi:hypothetical protein